MNRFDLDEKLKALRVPERSPGYWEMFPRRVLAQAQASSTRNASPLWWPRLVWGGGLALAILAVGFCSCPGLACPMKTVAYAVHSAQIFRAEVVQLPQSARALMRVDHGLHGLIAEEQ